MVRPVSGGIAPSKAWTSLSYRGRIMISVALANAVRV